MHWGEELSYLYQPFFFATFFLTSSQSAIKGKWSARNEKEKHDHWLEYASEKYDTKLIDDIKCVLNVLVIFLPIPVFWALFEQQVFPPSTNWNTVGNLSMFCKIQGLTLDLPSNANGWWIRRRLLDNQGLSDDHP